MRKLVLAAMMLVLAAPVYAACCGTLDIPSPFRFEKGYTIPGVAQVQTFYVYPTTQDAPSWLTRKYKTKRKTYR
jgi:hypothetical protein